MVKKIVLFLGVLTVVSGHVCAADQAALIKAYSEKQQELAQLEQKQAAQPEIERVKKELNELFAQIRGEQQPVQIQEQTKDDVQELVTQPVAVDYTVVQASYEKAQEMLKKFKTDFEFFKKHVVNYPELLESERLVHDAYFMRVNNYVDQAENKLAQAYQAWLVDLSSKKRAENVRAAGAHSTKICSWYTSDLYIYKYVRFMFEFLLSGLMDDCSIEPLTQREICTALAQLMTAIRGRGVFFFLYFEQLCPTLLPSRFQDAWYKRMMCGYKPRIIRELEWFSEQLPEAFVDEYLRIFSQAQNIKKDGIKQLQADIICCIKMVYEAGLINFLVDKLLILKHELERLEKYINDVARESVAAKFKLITNDPLFKRMMHNQHVADLAHTFEQVVNAYLTNQINRNLLMYQLFSAVAHIKSFKENVQYSTVRWLVSGSNPLCKYLDEMVLVLEYIAHDVAQTENFDRGHLIENIISGSWAGHADSLTEQKGWWSQISEKVLGKNHAVDAKKTMMNAVTAASPVVFAALANYFKNRYERGVTPQEPVKNHLNSGEKPDILKLLFEQK